ncbi:helix-turn-helix domain-containing protein [Natronogracilivirga saccharolytica]|uniref:ATP-binding protein n=1 Tax=Natronogracilivirga saccharolytica TaxID=2812953 RepID=A0A8J7RRP1_9BACT|nr:ATP-binding protein [Natronogracilivirga saccharolytica]MBP3191712.1 ATP-binding protein [Natronogracilivirga saccharolytica]
MTQQAHIHHSMSLRDLKNLIRSGEGLMLEFKRSISSPEKIAREIAAFANTHGGHLVIGVDDDRSIYGVESYHEQDFYLEQAAHELCSPALTYHMQVIPYYQREILHVYIEESDRKPVAVANGQGDAVYVRLDDQSVRASDEMTEILRSQSSNKGVTFHYGNNEQKLFRYLNEYPDITVDTYSNIADINRKKASQILVDLTSLGVLKLFKKNQTDVFTLAP